MRGHVSAGHGRVGKHRKHPGGRGNGGGQHHHRINFDKYHPGYFGKVGMRCFHNTQQRFHCPTINLEKIWDLGHMASATTPAVTHHTEDVDKIPVIDTIKHGFSKVLGKGRLPQKPILVKAKFVSKLAEKKIRAVGGAVILK